MSEWLYILLGMLLLNLILDLAQAYDKPGSPKKAIIGVGIVLAVFIGWLLTLLNNDDLILVFVLVIPELMILIWFKSLVEYLREYKR